MTRFTAIVLTVFTGFSGLVYEVAWQKYLATLLGSHGEATAAVLAIFLGGLSAGYSLFGSATRRLVERARERQRPPKLLVFYGFVEAGIGVYALAFPLLFGAVQKLSLFVPIGTASLAFSFDVMLAALLIGPPAVLMGGTIPILTLGLAGSRERATRIHALIYGSNTVGAFVGALAGAFILIPRLGLDGVIFAMGALNMVVGVVFMLLDYIGGRVAPDVEHGPPQTTGAIEQFKVYAAIALLAGFAMMAIQTTLNRIGALSFGSSHFTFAMIVAVFVLCIALGSLAVSLFRNISRTAIVITQWVLVVYLAALYVHVEDVPYWAHTIRVLFRDIDQIFYPYYATSFACIFVIFTIPIALSGALLPLLFHHLRGEAGDLGSVAGRLYSWNTVGSLVGALLGGYVLLFWLDLHQVYRLALAALVLEAALLTGVLFSISKRVIVAGVLVPALIALFALPAWEPERLSAGLFRRRAPTPTSFSGPDAHFDKVAKSPVIFYEDGPTSTVTVRMRTGEGNQWNRSIYLNGKSDGNLVADYPTMSLLALIPALMAENVERGFVIGFGTGVSAGELAALDSVREVEIAEISHAVIDAAPLFDGGNQGASKNPKVTIRRGDAYRTLMRSDGRYDVIVSEPSNPWVTGVEMLYSIEFLEVARAHLTPGGVFAQWIHLYALDADTIDLVLRNYANVFPHVSIWITQPRDLLLLGTNDPERAIDLSLIERRFELPDYAAGLRRAGIDSLVALLSREVLPLGTLHAANLEGPLHTLRHPRLSDRAARAFVAGVDVEMPKFLTPASVQIGQRNSLLRRYVGAGRGPLPEDVLEIAINETCEVQLVAECATLLAAWRYSYPDSQKLDEAMQRLRNDVAASAMFTERKLATLGRLFSSRSVRRLEGKRALARAKQLSELYVTHYHHATPFDRGVLRAVWADCTAAGCDKPRQTVEKMVGEFDLPRRIDAQQRARRADRQPRPNREADGAATTPVSTGS